MIAVCHATLLHNSQRERSWNIFSIVDLEAVGFGEIITRMEIFKAVLRERETYANTRQ